MLPRFELVTSLAIAQAVTIVSRFADGRLGFWLVRSGEIKEQFWSMAAVMYVATMSNAAQVTIEWLPSPIVIELLVASASSEVSANADVLLELTGRHSPAIENADARKIANAGGVFFLTLFLRPTTSPWKYHTYRQLPFDRHGGRG